MTARAELSSAGASQGRADGFASYIAKPIVKRDIAPRRESRRVPLPGKILSPVNVRRDTSRGKIRRLAARARLKTFFRSTMRLRSVNQSILNLTTTGWSPKD